MLLCYSRHLYVVSHTLKYSGWCRRTLGLLFYVSKLQPIRRVQNLLADGIPTGACAPQQDIARLQISMYQLRIMQELEAFLHRLHDAPHQTRSQLKSSATLVQISVEAVEDQANTSLLDKSMSKAFEDDFVQEFQ